MKLKEIAKEYGINAADFSSFVKMNKLDYTDSFSGIVIEESKVKEYVEHYKEAKRKYEEKQAQEEKVKAEKEAKKREDFSKILISSGFNFDGYTITKYSGYISGDDAIQIPRSGCFGGNNGSNLTDALVKIRRQALKELKEAAYNMGCNAIIGVDFDYLTLEPETVNFNGGTRYEPYVICVTANGNAVIIEKNEE